MNIGGAVVRIKPAFFEEVLGQLTEMRGVEIAQSKREGFAIVIEGESPKIQAKKHRDIARWPGVESVQLVFQSSEV